tara:strand:+ start:800 stop:1915 length:1116 start_codon:yes stop_codon:yes gene_type:complete
MKIRILVLCIILCIGCDNGAIDQPQIQLSKETVISKAVQKASPGVVGIYRNQEIVLKTWRGYRNLKPISSNGSGFIISDDGYILTNAHNIRKDFKRDDFRPEVITTDLTITVVIPGGESFNASIVGIDTVTDIALLKIEGQNFESCKLGDSDDIKVGQWAIALGNPENLIQNAQYQPIASAGIISAVNADFNIDSSSGRLLDNSGKILGDVKLLDNMIQTDASLNPGNSGGPLLDANGEVIGMNTFIKADSENLGFAIPINFVRKIANELRLKGAIDRRISFGVNATTYLYGKNTDQVGLFIDGVDYEDTARNEELFKGDIIVAIEGYKVESFEQIKSVLIKFDLRAGDEVKITVLRENDFKVVSLTLGSI